METNIKATNFIDLIKEGAMLGKKEVEVLFHPPYDEELHGCLRKELRESLKKPKTSIFSITEEGDFILELIKSKDAQTVKWK